MIAVGAILKRRDPGSHDGKVLGVITSLAAEDQRRFVSAPV
jgi:hypothetical protein